MPWPCTCVPCRARAERAAEWRKYGPQWPQKQRDRRRRPPSPATPRCAECATTPLPSTRPSLPATTSACGSTHASPPALPCARLVALPRRPRRSHRSGGAPLHERTCTQGRWGDGGRAATRVFVFGMTIWVVRVGWRQSALSRGLGWAWKGQIPTPALGVPTDGPPPAPCCRRPAAVRALPSDT